MSSLLNVSNTMEVFDIEVFVDNKEQNWIMRARIG